MTPSEPRTREQEIARRIAAFPRWHYQFNLDGRITPIHDPDKVNRHQLRKQLFFDPLCRLFNGTLKGKRVLDLGCNAGFWSMHALEAGCDFVLGIDGRSMHIEQAELVFETLNLDRNRYRFIQSDVFDVDFQPYGPFDVVLFLGLLYHVNKPMELLEKIDGVNSDILVIDTTIAKGPASFIRLIHEDTDDPKRALHRRLVFRPSKRAVLDMVEQLGYTSCVLEPNFDDYTGARDYKLGKRKTFICSKKTDLTPLLYQQRKPQTELNDE